MIGFISSSLAVFQLLTMLCWWSWLEIADVMQQRRMYQDEKPHPQLGMVFDLNKILLTPVLIISNFPYWIWYFPIISYPSTLIFGWLTAWFFDIIGRTHIDKEFHFMSFVSTWYNKSSKTKLWFKFNQLHMFRQLSFFFHLLQILIIFCFIFRIRYFNHVLI